MVYPQPCTFISKQYNLAPLPALVLERAQLLCEILALDPSLHVSSLKPVLTVKGTHIMNLILALNDDNNKPSFWPLLQDDALNELTI